jgi:hypothetical protein
MKPLLAALCLIGVNVPHALAEGANKPSRNGLSLAIILTKDKAGISILNRGGMFQVVFTNHSPKPGRKRGRSSFRSGNGRKNAPQSEKSSASS